MTIFYTVSSSFYFVNNGRENIDSNKTLKIYQNEKSIKIDYVTEHISVL